MFTAIVALILAQGDPAQQMQPLPDIVEHVARPYPYERCAVLYQSMMEWAGIDRLGAETWERAESARRSQILHASILSHEVSGGTLEEQVSNVLRRVRHIADLYLTRFESNYAVGGQAFADDRVVTGDLEFCQVLSSQLSGSLE